LQTLRAELPDTALCLIVGMDQFHALDKWHEWRAIVDLAHICVAQRPGAAMPRSGAVARMLPDRQVSDPGRLREAVAGYIFVASVPVLDISSTRIRALISRHQDPSFLVPDGVLQIIHAEQIYDEFP
jgi:nicotinate-nucleotide adenylyltransferase